MVVLASFGLCLAALIPFTGRAQGALTNGWANAGAISAAGETDTWTIAANPGDRITVQISKLSGGAGFTPRIERQTASHWGSSRVVWPRVWTSKQM